MPQPQKFAGDQKHFIAPFEVILHNRAEDCWVSLLGKVLDITTLLHEFQKQDCIRVLVAQAGKDISQWFDKDTEDICHYVHPMTGVRVPYCPYGLLPHVAPQVPTTQWRRINIPWWKDDK